MLVWYDITLYNGSHRVRVNVLGSVFLKLLLWSTLNSTLFQELLLDCRKFHSKQGAKVLGIR